MKYSYGIVDKREILSYKPQLFQRTDDLLIFPSNDFLNLQSSITEFIDGLYQINHKNRQIY